MARTENNQSGYTLIELLLYVVLVGALLTSVTFFFGLIADSRVKNQTIGEINDQGQMIMDTLTQTIRNATSITTPASGVSAPSLTLAVPTGTLSPTVFDLSGTSIGYALDGTTTDSSNKNNINATKFVAGATGAISALYAYMGPVVAASPNNLGQMAIYSGTSSPTTLLASSSSVALKASTWNTFPISTVSVVSGQTYWLAYNTNGLAITDNNLRYHTGTTGQTQFFAQTYGAWPASFTGTAQGNEFAEFAMIDPTGTPGAVRIKEGAGAVTPLTSNDMHLTGLNFRNLSRAGTPGLVQVNFTLSRVNPLNRNEYDYQKSFTSSAEVGW